MWDLSQMDLFMCLSDIRIKVYEYGLWDSYVKHIEGKLTQSLLSDVHNDADISFQFELD